MSVGDLFKGQLEEDDDDDDDDFSEDDEEEEDDDDEDEEDSGDDEDMEGELDEESEEDEEVQPASKKVKLEKQPVSAKKEKVNTDGDKKSTVPSGTLEAQTLFIKNLPSNCTVEEIKALSKDILQVRLRTLCTIALGKNKERPGFAYLEFANEATAEKNFGILANAAIRGNKLVVDYMGEKSSFLKNKTKHTVVGEIDPLKLFVAGLPDGTVEADLRKFFPQATSITIPVRRSDKKVLGYGFVTFATEPLAKQYNNKSQNLSLKGVTLAVMFAKKHDDQKAKKEKAKKGAEPAAKKAKLEVEESDEDDDDDDDDEDDDDDDEDDDDDDEDDDDDDEDDDDDDEAPVAEDDDDDDDDEEDDE